MPKQTKIEEGTLLVTRTRFNRKTNVEDGDISKERIEVREFQTEAARVIVSAKQTFPLEPYASLTIEVGFNVPCYTEEMAEVQKELVTKLPTRVRKAYDHYCETNGIELE